MMFRVILLTIFIFTNLVFGLEPLKSFTFRCPNYNCSTLQHSALSASCCYISQIKLDKETNITFINEWGSGVPVRGIIIVESEMEEIPEDLFYRLQPVVLHIIGSGLKIIKRESFSGARILHEVNFTNNKIEVLPPNAFGDANYIEVIDLSNNRITEVFSYAFAKIWNLRLLNLSNNLIKVLKFDVFGNNCPPIQFFMMSNNSLTEIHQQFFVLMKSLKELRLDNNKLNISHFDVDSFLEVFDMSNNPSSVYVRTKMFKIRNTNTTVLTIKNQVTLIDASENLIHSVVVDSGYELTELNLSKNKFTSIQNLTALFYLETLDLSFNNIQDFSSTSFLTMLFLKELNLENSGLKTIDFVTFKRQRNLMSLDISYNNLHQINFTMLPIELERLYIEGNDLTEIDITQINVTFERLSTLGLSNNKFSCDKLPEYHKQLSAMNIEMKVNKVMIAQDLESVYGITCLSGNRTATSCFLSNDWAPSHMTRNTVRETIENPIPQRSEYLQNRIINCGGEILTISKDIADLFNETVLKLSKEKCEILLRLSDQFTVSKIHSLVTSVLKSITDEATQITLERYQHLMYQLNILTDKMENLKKEFFSGKILLLNHVSNEHNAHNIITKADGVDFSLMKNMITFLLVILLLIIFGFAVMFCKKCHSPRQHRHTSINSYNDQSVL